jgi:hypothetical protein
LTVVVPSRLALTSFNETTEQHLDGFLDGRVPAIVKTHELCKMDVRGGNEIVFACKSEDFECNP